MQNQRTSPDCSTPRQLKYDLRRRVLITNFIKDRQSCEVFTSPTRTRMSRMWGYTLSPGPKSVGRIVPTELRVPSAVPVIRERRVKSPRKIGSLRTGILRRRSMERTESYKKAVLEGNQNLVDPDGNHTRKRASVSDGAQEKQPSLLRSYLSTSRLLPNKPLSSSYRQGLHVASSIASTTRQQINHASSNVSPLQAIPRHPRPLPFITPTDAKLRRIGTARCDQQAEDSCTRFGNPVLAVPPLKVPSSTVSTHPSFTRVHVPPSKPNGNPLAASTPIKSEQSRPIPSNSSDEGTALMSPPSPVEEGVECVSRSTQTSPPPKKRRSLLRRSSSSKKSVEKMLNGEGDREKDKGLKRRASFLKTLLNKIQTSSNRDDTLTPCKSTKIVRTRSLKENRAPTPGKILTRPKRAASMRGRFSDPQSRK
ncbi:uncharacterized protein LOC135392180 [Ornithodoros turicata]|uniref:uncharacterized protein LOC135392180 n=1 Tax=Ornithodoros turicata TaxID=34597 RepID=UPI0031397589